MSLPYIPGIGDYMMKVGPELGKNLQQIIQPWKDEEEDLKKMLLANPEMLNSYLEREKANPGSLAAVFGPKASQYIQSQGFTPTYQTEKKQKEANLKFTEGGIKRQELDAERDTITNEELKKYTSYFNALPEDSRNAAYFQKTFGLSPERYKLVETQAVKDNEKLAIAAKFKGLNPTQIIDEIWNNKSSHDIDTLDAIINSNPQGFAAALSLYNNKKSEELRKELENRQDKLGFDNLIRAMLPGAVAEMRETGMSGSPFALIQSWFPSADVGKALGGVTIDPNEVKSIESQRQTLALRQQRKQDMDLYGKINNSIKTIAGGGLSGQDVTLLRSEINAQLAELGRRYGVDVPEYKAVPNARDGWFLGDKKIGNNELSAVLSDLVRKIYGSDNPY